MKNRQNPCCISLLTRHNTTLPDTYKRQQQGSALEAVVLKNLDFALE